MNTHSMWMGWLAVAVLSAGVAAGKPVETPGKIGQVTVYRGQALVTRVVETAAPPGAVDMVVTDLPTQIVPGSLYAAGDANVLIRAVRYRKRAVKEEPRPEIREIDKQIEALGRQLREIQAQTALQKQKENYLASLEKFATDKTAKDLDKGALKVETVVKLTEFLFKQRGQLSDEGLQRNEKETQLKQQQALLQRKRQELTSKSTRTAREAVLFLEKKKAGKAAVRLNYLVGGASWSPSYSLRCAARGEQVELEYNALLQQMSGEDWDAVALKLSTASPAMLASAPIVTPLWITLSPPRPQGKAGQKAPRQSLSSYLGGQRAYRGNLRKALRGRDVQLNAVDSDWAINVEANRLQIMDLLAAKDVILSGQDMAAVSDDVLSVRYSLPGQIGVPSRDDQQMIQIASMKLTGKFYYLATPVLTPYVYQHVDVVNSSNVALLAGPVSTYMNGQFTGTGRVPIVAKGQHFTVGFGVDSQLRVKRVLAV